MMKAMFSHEEALKILCLKDGFTEDELTHAYRTLSKQFHPDLNVNSKEAEEQFKRVNEAHRILKNFLNKLNGSNYTSNEISITEYKKQRLSLFVIAIHYNDISDADNIVIFQNIVDFMSILTLTVAMQHTKEEVDKIINLAYNKFDNIVSEEVSSFCLQNGITKEDINKIFNLEFEMKKRNFKELYSKLNNALLKIKKSKIEEIVNKYTNYAGYEIIKNKIEKFKQEAIESNNTILSIMVELQEKINEAFKCHFENMSLLNELDELSKSINNPEILEEIKALTTKVDSDDFKSLYNDLKGKIELNSLDSLLNEINQKGAEALKSCKSIDESIQIYTTFSKLSELLNQIQGQKIPITEDLKNMLNWETLINFNDDMNLNVSDYPDIDNIYVKVKYASPSDKKSFFIEKDGYLYKIINNTFKGEIVSKDENFISLSEFLEKSKFEGKFCFKPVGTYLICTYKAKRCIYLLNSERNPLIGICSVEQLHMSFYQPLKENYEKYDDKVYLTQIISEQLNKVLDKELDNQDNKSGLKLTKKRYRYQ